MKQFPIYRLAHRAKSIIFFGGAPLLAARCVFIIATFALVVVSCSEVVTPSTNNAVQPIRDLKLVQTDHQSIMVTWTNPDVAFDSIHVRFIDDSSNALIGDGIVITDGSQSTTIDELTINTKYTVVVVAYNNGQESTRQSEYITIMPIVPMVSALSELITKIGDGKITLSWTNPSEPTFSHVEIVYAPTNDTDGSTSMTVRILGALGATETTTITDLTNGTEYTFTITTYHSDGTSMEDITKTVTPVAPMVSAVSELSTKIGDGEITLSWTNPSEPNFSHVEIVYALTDDAGGDTSMPVRIPETDPGMPGATETTTITGLTNDSEYTFTVNVYDTDDRITPSTITATPRDITPPDPVTNLFAVLSDLQQVTVSWTNPSDADFGYADLDYGVSGTGDTTRIRVPATGFGTSDATESVVISDLTEGADYSFTVISYDKEEPVNGLPSSSSPTRSVLLSNEANPYTITTRAQLQSIATGFSNAQITTPLSKKVSLAGHYRLANSLTVGNFTSIGDATMPFRGTFNGDGNTLMDLEINGTTPGNWGLFGVVSDGTIGNLQLDNPNVTGNGNVGALVGLLGTSGTVRNSASTGGRVTGSNSNDIIGGLVGSSNGTVTSNYATANVDGLGGDDRVGGLIGVNNAMGMVTNNYATGSVNGLENDDRVGGLIGINNGMVTDSYATGNVNGGGGNNDHVGGLIGSNSSIIRSSYATGNATGGEGVNNNVGRLLGSHSATVGQVTHAYYYGSALVSVGRDISLGDQRSYRQLTSGDIMDLPGFTAADWEFESTKLPAVKGTDGITLAGQPFALPPPGDGNVPYLVRSADELQSIATGFSSAQTDTPLGLADSLAAHYRVVSNIDLSSIGNFLPIGTDTTPFNGTFDGGNNHGVVISGLTINSTEDGFWGLFGTVSGTVRNVALSNNIAITGSGRAGALMGKLRSGGAVDKQSCDKRHSDRPGYGRRYRRVDRRKQRRHYNKQPCRKSQS